MSTSSSTSSVATFSLSNAAKSKFKIEQKVPSGSKRKGPYAVERALDPDKVVIKRRFGEGSKPLFERDDITVNPRSSREQAIVEKDTNALPKRQNLSVSHSPSRHKTHRTSSHHRHTNRSRSPRRAAPVSVPKKPVTAEKVPYFLDEKREQDRLRRLYGNETRSSAAQNFRNSRSTGDRSRRRSRSRTPPTRHSGRISSSSSYQSRHNSPSTERYRSNSSRQEQRQEERTLQRRYRRSSSRGTNREVKKEESGTTEQPTLPATQIITVPVPVSEFSYYPYPGWPPQPNWGVPPYMHYPAPRALVPAPGIPPMRLPHPHHPFPIYPTFPAYNSRMYRPRYNSRPNVPRVPRTGSNRS